MKRAAVLLLLCFGIASCTQREGEPVPGKFEWQHTLGGAGNEVPTGLLLTKDQNIVVVGYTTSAEGNISENHGLQDYWIVNLSQTGEIRWQKTYGGPSYDVATAIVETLDDGFVVTGYSGATGLENYSIMRLNSTGEVLWQKEFGGSNVDIPNSIIALADGGYIIAGYSNSTDKDVTGNHGGFDYWIIKIDEAGNLMWQKALGGTLDDQAKSITSTPDGGFIVVGYAGSSDGDVTMHAGNPLNGEHDFWVVKLDGNGSMVWQKSLGGAHRDEARSVVSTGDGGCVVAGYTEGNDGVEGPGDCWVVRLNQDGGYVWQETLGGTGIDDGKSIAITEDGNLVVAIATSSNDKDVTTNHGGYDYWIVKLDANGKVIQQDSFGGSTYDGPTSIISLPDRSTIVAGQTESNDGDVTNNHGLTDWWVFRMREK